MRVCVCVCVCVCFGACVLVGVCVCVCLYPYARLCVFLVGTLLVLTQPHRENAYNDDEYQRTDHRCVCVCVILSRVCVKEV